MAYIAVLVSKSSICSLEFFAVGLDLEILVFFTPLIVILFFFYSLICLLDTIHFSSCKNFGSDYVQAIEACTVTVQAMLFIADIEVIAQFVSDRRIL